jgi:hypothetical protein
MSRPLDPSTATRADFTDSYINIAPLMVPPPPSRNRPFQSRRARLLNGPQQPPNLLHARHRQERAVFRVGLCDADDRTIYFPPLDGRIRMSTQLITRRRATSAAQTRPSHRPTTISAKNGSTRAVAAG